MTEKEATMDQPILEMQNVSVGYRAADRNCYLLDSIDFNISPGETVGLVGESGCGKSMTGLTIMGLLPNPVGELLSGEFLFENKSLNVRSEKQMRPLRGKKISMIFQDPNRALNPMFTIGNQLKEMIRQHQTDLSPKEIHSRAIELLEKVGLPDAEDKLQVFPHQLSGGMKQRVVIAIAVSCRPRLLIADEPTTALDVTIQAQIITMLKRLIKSESMALLLISHDFGLISENSDRLAVMYAGQIIESGNTEAVLQSPKHRYTESLLQSIPKMGDKKKRLKAIAGEVPAMNDLPRGCRFQSRCQYASSNCSSAPTMQNFTGNHRAACHHPSEI